MTTANKQEIEMIMVDTNNEIIDMLAEIKKHLHDPHNQNNHWGHVGDARRLRGDLRDILEYLK